MSTKKEDCFYCGQASEFTQPEKSTGEIISVCRNHFSFMYMG